jgi:tetratricopeptide (TPR) repeat protein
LFAGRDEDLADLHTALLGANGAPVALHGLGGIGKTRLAIEYAWSREAVYSALLFVSATDSAALNAGLAGLTAFEVLDLTEKEARDDATKTTAVLRWLESNPKWLMILDNVDDRAAVAEVAKLMPRLKGGHVVVTARASNFPAGVRKLEVSALDENAAARFLLDRTDADRSKSKDDAALAPTLARELGGLALGLEQAGAHIATDRIGFARYLKLWSDSRDKALAWADATVTGSDRTLATTWATSVARLSPDSRRLLDRLAKATNRRAEAEPLIRRALTILEKSLGPEHPRVATAVNNLAGLLWATNRLADAEPLFRRALAIDEKSLGPDHPDVAIDLSNLGFLLKGTNHLAEAEPLMRRALAIFEARLGPDHPSTVTARKNLAGLQTALGQGA